MLLAEKMGIISNHHEEYYNGYLTEQTYQEVLNEIKNEALKGNNNLYIEGKLDFGPHCCTEYIIEMLIHEGFDVEVREYMNPPEIFIGWSHI